MQCNRTCWVLAMSRPQLQFGVSARFILCMCSLRQLCPDKNLMSFDSAGVLVCDLYLVVHRTGYHLCMRLYFCVLFHWRCHRDVSAFLTILFASLMVSCDESVARPFASVAASFTALSASSFSSRSICPGVQCRCIGALFSVCILISAWMPSMMSDPPAYSVWILSWIERYSPVKLAGICGDC